MPGRHQQRLDGHVERPVHAGGPRDQANAAAERLGEVAIVRPELDDIPRTVNSSGRTQAPNAR